MVDISMTCHEKTEIWKMDGKFKVRKKIKKRRRKVKRRISEWTEQVGLKMGYIWPDRKHQGWHKTGEHDRQRYSPGAALMNGRILRIACCLIDLKSQPLRISDFTPGTIEVSLADVHECIWAESVLGNSGWFGQFRLCLESLWQFLLRDELVTRVALRTSSRFRLGKYVFAVFWCTENVF